MTESSNVVWIVDDDSSICGSIARAVKCLGRQAVMFSSAESCWEQLQTTMPSCLIVDQRMAGMSGVDLCLKLRDAAIGAPVILISGHNDPIDAANPFDFVVSFLAKPFSLEDLEQALVQADNFP